MESIELKLLNRLSIMMLVFIIVDIVYKRVNDFIEQQNL